MAAIRVDRLHKRFRDFIAVQDSSFTIHNGEFFVMLGPSGCGKTTTLRMIAGLELPTSGEILLDDEAVTFKRAAERDIAFVFQLFALYPHMNVRRNIGFPLLCQGTPRGEIRTRVEETARLLRIDQLLDSPVSGLSGGDRQRVALGRAIVRRPRAFLMDEPLGALDTEFRDLMIHELRGLHERIQATTVYVTHDQLEAMAMADRILVMNHGVVEQCATPQEIYDEPASVFVADFIGSPSMNLLRFQGRLRRGDTQISLNGLSLPIPQVLDEAPGESLVLGVRPEHIELSDNAPLRGEVYGTEYLGTQQIITLQTPHGTMKARVASTQRVQPGEQLGLALRTPRLSLFDAESGRALALQRPQEWHHG